MEVISYNGWDSPYTQYVLRYTYHGQYLDHDFIDAEQADWTAWRKTGDSYYGQSSVVGPNGYIYFMDTYGINFTMMENAIERVIYGPSSDTDPPYIYYDDPDPGETGVDPNTDIKGRLYDDGFGIDLDTLTFEVTYPGSGGPVPGNLSEETGSNFLDFRGVFNPSDPLPENTEITVEIWAEDLLGNDDLTEWTFTTGDLVGIKSVSIGELKATFK